jgi:acyl dehydratase
MYAGASFDFNPAHHDYRFAVAANHPDLLAHGMLIMGFATTCIMEGFGGETLIRGVGGRFLASVYVGDVVDVAALAGDAPDKFHLEARVGEKIVFRGWATVWPSLDRNVDSSTI